MAGVRLENVSKIYAAGRHPPAVDGVSLDIADGEFVVLVGPSGCGKSTILRLIAGLETPTSGAVFIGDRQVNDVSPSARDIAMVFQSYALYPHMTVRENLAFALTLRRLPSAEITQRVGRAAQMLDLVDYLDRKPRQLSGGQRQRVALGRAIVREPKVFLFDEPLSNLDAALRTQTRREIAGLHRTLGTTMIYVTHDQVEAMTLGQRIVVMQGGRVQQVDTPIALYDAPANRFVAGFLGSPAMNFLRGTVDAASGGIRLDAADTVIRSNRLGGGALGVLGGRSVEVGVRSEDVVVRSAGDGSMGPNTVRGVIDFVETLGNEALVSVRVGDASSVGVPPVIVARSETRRAMDPGTSVECTLDPAHIHLFDTASGAALP
jgi:multiple sugar transport system ATP-binding protein